MTDQKSLNLEQLRLITLQLVEKCHDINVLKTVLAASVLGAEQLPVDEARLVGFKPLYTSVQIDSHASNPTDHIQKLIEHAVTSGFLVRTSDSLGLAKLNFPAGTLNGIPGKHQPRLIDPADQQKSQIARPNAFELYEQHIGLITPIIADKIIEALRRHSEPVVEEAIKDAAANNHRHWRYIEVVLENRTSEGQNNETHQRDHEEHLNSEKYLHGKYASLFRKR